MNSERTLQPLPWCFGYSRRELYHNGENGQSWLFIWNEWGVHRKQLFNDSLVETNLKTTPRRTMFLLLYILLALLNKCFSVLLILKVALFMKWAQQIYQPKYKGNLFFPSLRSSSSYFPRTVITWKWPSITCTCFFGVSIVGWRGHLVLSFLSNRNRTCTNLKIYQKKQKTIHYYPVYIRLGINSGIPYHKVKNWITYNMYYKCKQLYILQ